MPPIHHVERTNPRNHRARKRAGKRAGPVGQQAPTEPTQPRPEIPPNNTNPGELRISNVSEAYLCSRKPLVKTGTLNETPVRILVDSGAMGNFVAASTVEKNALHTVPVVNIPLSFANGTKSSCNKSVAAASLCFEHHCEKLDFRVAPLTHYDVILGKPWLETWNPTINWRTNTI